MPIRPIFASALVSVALTTAACQTAPSLSSPAPPARAGAETPADTSAADGAQRVDAMPEHWNGTLLLFSRGYSRSKGDVAAAPEGTRKALLSAGYALAASDYGTGGWALEQAIPAQLRTINWFAARHGKPRRVIAYGNSMGGLVTTAVAEDRTRRIDGAVAFCPSIGGALGMMNVALDGGFVFRTLVAPDAGIELVRVSDDTANAKRVDAAVQQAMREPESRARLALSAVLAGLPDWTVPASPRPAPTDTEKIAEQFAAAFTRGVFMPRGDQEARAGGNFSWNTAVDYRAQLERSGRRALVEALYAKAGLSLDSDLAILAQTPRISANKNAVKYMRAHYTPDGNPRAPLLAVQKIGDGMTAPAMLRGYAQVAPAQLFAQAWIEEAGHCNFTAEQVLSAVHHLEARLADGRWSARIPTGFIAYNPEPMLRPCVRTKACK